jgi:hypothetical protein
MSRTVRSNRKTGADERDTYHRNTHQSAGCRHHGSCDRCSRGRTHASRRREPIGQVFP